MRDATVDAPGDTLGAADESDLCRLWATQAFPNNGLTTMGGAALQVVYPGRRSGTGGPDFQGAILADAAGRVRGGDVEVHLRSRDWITHGHQADPAYNDVILHVVLHDDGDPCLRADGIPVPVLALGRIVDVPLTTAPLVAESESCRVSPALLTADVSSIVRAAGRERINGKAAALEAQIEVLGPEQALFAALLDAAGYSRNRAPCAMLAERLPVERLQALMAAKELEQALPVATVIVLGLAGLLAAQADPALTALWQGYADLWPLPPLSGDVWVRAAVRPANRPELRLRGIAALLARTARDGLVASLLAPLRHDDIQRLVASLEVTTPGERTPPIGRGRALEMAVNVVTPFALALARRDGEGALEDTAWRVVAAMPAADDSASLRSMRALLAGSGHRLRPYGALEQQGLLHLHRSYCHVRACWECPLAT